MKVNIPTGLLLDLHRIKILTGKSISETVGDALDAYFARLPDDKGTAHPLSQTDRPDAGASAPSIDPVDDPADTLE